MSAGANMAIFRAYAQKSNPDSLPSSVLLSHSETCLTVFDAFPKSIFHFLVIPRVRLPFDVYQLADLRSLLKCEKNSAKELLTNLNQEADNVKKMIESEMLKKYGFKWEIWMGFHAVPSMQHLHLHILSADLCSPRMKLKKHYNSFHPKLGFFIHLSDVLSWFESDSSYYKTISQLKKSEYEPLLKEDLSCWKCDRNLSNMPKLKSHLQEDFDKLSDQEKAKAERKRKRVDDPAKTSSLQTSSNDELVRESEE
ncbi:HIT-like domain-containing protein [Suillus clintonianus]|uniref:HIT-like domain-containing protein n=1 Tax=Suillus clintonianus TaxID=1904413 RepID=UPI001B86FF9F|nr:HIT-like domain-containing protein [Suillus clintonianus]KAG2157296.1 HIT-like domain-containing protein [Suillus clintonianus]